LNETWVKVDREGVYFGQCSELCGARHGYMPIAVEVVSRENFERWVLAQGGSMPGSEAASDDAAETAPADNETAVADDAAATAS
jgi:cytochrome c oxidase subunit 2